MATGGPAPQLAAARRWEETILRVAVEEMGHLGTVSNLLGAVGENAWFDRPNFPQVTGYYPVPFDLVGFDDEALYRMLVFEPPPGSDLPDPPHRPPADERALAISPVPDPLEYSYVGDLYAQIRDGIAEVVNKAYAAVLLMLAHVFAFGEGPAQPDAMKAAVGQMVSTAVRPLAEVLTGLPAFVGGDDSACAATNFDLYRAPTLSPFPAARWTVLLDRLHTLATAARSLEDIAPRLGVIGETVSFLRRNLGAVVRSRSPGSHPRTTLESSADRRPEENADRCVQR